MTKTEFKEVVNLALSKGNQVYIPELQTWIYKYDEFYELRDLSDGVYLRYKDLDKLVDNYWKILVIIGGTK